MSVSSEDEGDSDHCAFCDYCTWDDPYPLDEDWESCYKCSKCNRYACEYCRDEPCADEYTVIVCDECNKDQIQ